MSINRTPAIDHADWCSANRADSGSTTCIAIHEQPVKDDGYMADGGTERISVCQVCGVTSSL